MRSTPRLQSKAQALVQELCRLEPKDIKKQLHVNDALAKQYSLHLNQFQAKQPVPCCCLYDLPIFNAAQLSSFDEDDAEWANTHVRIFSGLYGFLRPYDEIQTLSLPVGLSTKLKNSKGAFLRDFWQEAIDKEIEDAVQKLYDPIIVNMAAEEDQVMVDQDKLPEGTRVVKVDFKISRKDDALAAKGELLRWMMQNRCMTVEELLEFKGLEDDEGEEMTAYRLHKNQPNPDVLVFEEDRGDGGDGAWNKKFQEFGGSKQKFVKEFSSGKDKHRRGEIKKALEKDERKQRKKGSAAFY